jgi:hypothetical protein|tara:strand:+ start:604 stop:819 length:216 start_codon:yes stop_codon:yes gene_type:complete
MTVEITLTIAGSNTSLFDIYSNSDGFINPVGSNVPVASLTSGTEFIVPDNTTTVRVQALEECVNYIDIQLA